MKLSTHLARLSVSALAIGAATPLFAQSTGTQAFDQPEIVVTGQHGPQAVAGIATPNTPKTRQVLTQALITHLTPGQTINDTINLVPGVSFQNNDGYGSSGGFLTIRGFDQSRISETFDGIPLNDTGNYALYSNQLLDPELIDQVNVSLGSTDVDSPTPSATGSTVNFTTADPTEDFHARLQGSFGQFDMLRIFGKIDTGTLTKYGTRAWIAASKQTYNAPNNDFGKVDKQQYNFKIMQPIGSSGDFIKVGGHYNKNNNNFFGSSPLRNDTTILSATGAVIGSRIPGPDSNLNRFPDSADERNYQDQLYYKLGNCARLAPGAGAQVETTTLSVTGANQNQAACGSEFDDRYNPSKTANIRINSRFTLTPQLILTVDPFYEYTDANGGGTVKASEGTYTETVGGKPVFTGGLGYFGGTFYTGRDLNGDGDTRDTTLLLAPSNTVTNRYGVIANLLWNFTDTQTVRVNYTLDYGHHRQTGEAAALTVNGSPINLFPHDSGAATDVAGDILQKRNRLSLAILNQVAGQYRGKFFDEKLTVEAGVRGAFFQRKLDQRCFTTAGNGNVDCPDTDAQSTAYALANPVVINPTTGLTASGFNGPQKRDYHFNKALPSGGLVFQLTPSVSLYGDYSKGLQVPGTDQLYNAYYFPQNTAAASPKPETSDNFDAGVRMRSGKIQAQFAGWYTVFKNRIEQNYDPILQLSTYTNLGTVHKYGFDGSIAYQVVPQLSLYAFGSYLKSKILDDVQIGNCTASGLNTTVAPIATACTAPTATAAGSPIFANTAGKRESGAPTYTFGGRAQGSLGPVELGVTAKRTGPRYINDQNTAVYQSYGTGAATTFYQVYGSKTPSYTLVDLDARLSLAPFGFNDRTYLQFNVTNLFDKFFVGATSTSNATPSNTTVNFWQIGAPRTISGTFSIGF